MKQLKKSKLLVLLVCTALIFCALAACGGGDGGDKTTPVTPTITLDETSIELQVTEQKKLTATKNISDAVVTWTSNNSSIASVDNTGLVTAVAPGSTTIRARITVEGTNYNANCSVTVNAPPSDLELSKYSFVLAPSDVTTAVTITTEGWTQSASWESEDPAVATVSNGVITAVAAGTTFVTATSDGRRARVSVLVRGANDFQGFTAISTKEQFLAIENNLSGKYYLTADIDFGGDVIEPIGTSARDTGSLKGILDGNGFAVKNFKIDKPTKFNVPNAESPADGKQYLTYGLFGRIDTTGVVRNLNIIGGEVWAQLFTGGVAGSNFGLIENCYVEVEVWAENWWNGWDCPGGILVGINEGDGVISNCIANGIGHDYVFPLAGWNLGTIEKSRAILDNMVVQDTDTIAGAVQDAGIPIKPTEDCDIFFMDVAADADKYDGFGSHWVFEYGKMPYLISTAGSRPWATV